MYIGSVEPEGTFVRRVRPFEQKDAQVVWDKLKTVPNFLGSLSPETLFDPKLEIVLIDDIGAGVLDDRTDQYARVHITFWDKRLRGREYLCKRIAQMFMDKYNLGYVYSTIPHEARTVIAFARRIGFKEFGADEKYMYLVLYR